MMRGLSKIFNTKLKFLISPKINKDCSLKLGALNYAYCFSSS